MTKKNNTETLDIGAKLVAQHFGIQLTIPETWTHELLLVQVERVVSQMLNADMERLLQALYRIDVNEKTVKKILTEAPPESMSREIAELIIAREMQKAVTRLQYRT